MFRDKIIAAIRTGCAALGAFVLTWIVNLLTGWGLDVELDPELQTMLVGLLFAAFVAAYNLAIAWLTENVWDGFGWLLGVNKPPAYVDTDLRNEPDEDPGLAVDSSEIRADDSDSPEFSEYNDYGYGDPHRE